MFDCINYGGQWIKSDNNFDDIFESILTLFQMTMVGWVVQAQQGMSVRGIGQTKNTDIGSNYMAYFFIFYIVFCSFFILNLFMGVVISSYNREKDDLCNNSLLTSSQKKWLEGKKMIVQTKLKFFIKKPQGPFKRKMYSLVTNSRFDQFIMACIVVNTLILCLKWYDEP